MLIAESNPVRRPAARADRARSALRGRTANSAALRRPRRLRRRLCISDSMRGVDREALLALLHDERPVAVEVLAVPREPQARVRRLHPERVDELLGVGL